MSYIFWRGGGGGGGGGPGNLETPLATCTLEDDDDDDDDDDMSVSLLEEPEYPEKTTDLLQVVPICIAKISKVDFYQHFLLTKVVGLG